MNKYQEALQNDEVDRMKIVKITFEELQKWKAARYDNQVIKNILAKHLNVKSSEIDDYEQINYGLTFNVCLIDEVQE
ncbi:MAG: hypothetical protein WBK20_07695 [Spirochaetota bacterium]